MDHFFDDEYMQSYAFSWFNLCQVNQSAFQAYTSIPTTSNQIPVNGSSNSNNNMNKKMLEFVKRSFPVRSSESQESESTRCFHRRITERMRREKEKKEYLALHSVLPLGTKNDKNSIMRMASKRIQELDEYKQVLEKRNYELEVKLNSEMGNARKAKIEFKVAPPLDNSGMTYLVEVLKCLNSLGAKIRNIQSSFSDHQLVAVMDIETQISDGDVRNEVQRALDDVQRKLQFHFQQL